MVITMMRPKEEKSSQYADVAARGVTVEMALWIALVVLALALRWFHLGTAPLSAAEAREAMLAWRAVIEGEVPLLSDYSPFLLSANAFLFALLGSGDAVARFWPLLFGVGLVLTPALFRQQGQVGRGVALLAGLFLAISPTALVASRRLDGGTAAACGVMILLGGLWRFRHTERRRDLLWAAGGLALAITSGAMTYTLLLSLALAGILALLLFHSSSLTTYGRFLTQVRASFSRLSHLFASRRADLGIAIGVFAVVAVGLATGLWWNPVGVGAIGGLWAQWLAAFSLGGKTAAGVPVSPLTLLLLYEPLALCLAVAGFVWALRWGYRWASLMGLWAATLLVVLAVFPARIQLDISALMLPLAWLAAIAADRFVHHIRERADWLNEGLYLPIVVVLWGHLYLLLANYARNGYPLDLLLAVMTFILQGVLVLVFALLVDPMAARRVFALGTLVALATWTLATGWQAAYVRYSDPHEPLHANPTAPEVRDLRQSLRDLAWRRTGFPTTLPFVVETPPDSVLTWYTRDFSVAQRVDALPTDAVVLPPVLVTERKELALSGFPDAGEGADAGQYVGQAFVVHRVWDPTAARCVWGAWPPQCQDLVRWWLFRQTTSFDTDVVVTRWAVLWLVKES